ncbi:MAG: hypothetical protein QF737_05180 [Dehalococcoidales bacterium]|nr:hypothetical protein [Dehalococcoidales bacterium]
MTLLLRSGVHTEWFIVFIAKIFIQKIKLNGMGKRKYGGARTILIAAERE